MQKIIIFLINFFDFFHKRKIINFLKKENFNEYEIILDASDVSIASVSQLLYDLRNEQIHSPPLYINQ